MYHHCKGDGGEGAPQATSLCSAKLCISSFNESNLHLLLFVISALGAIFCLNYVDSLVTSDGD